MHACMNKMKIKSACILMREWSYETCENDRKVMTEICEEKQEPMSLWRGKKRKKDSRLWFVRMSIVTCFVICAWPQG